MRARPQQGCNLQMRAPIWVLGLCRQHQPGPWRSRQHRARLHCRVHFRTSGRSSAANGVLPMLAAETHPQQVWQTTRRATLPDRRELRDWSSWVLHTACSTASVRLIWTPALGLSLHRGSQKVTLRMPFGTEGGAARGRGRDSALGSAGDSRRCGPRCRHG